MMRRGRPEGFPRLLAPALACAALTGCADNERAVGALSDAAYSAPVYDLRLEASSDPSLPIVLVSDLKFDASGRIFVSDAQIPQILVLDSLGQLLDTWERPGDGPGEFRRIESLGRLTGDTLSVFDSELGRLTFLDSSDGSYLSSMSLIEQGTRMPSAVLPVGNGSLLVWRSAPDIDEGAARAGDRFDTIELVERSAMDFKEVFRIPSRQNITLEAEGQMTAVFDFFAAEPLVQVGPEGNIYRVRSDTMGVSGYDSSGNPISSWSVELPHDAATPEELAEVEELMAMESGAGGGIHSLLLDSIAASASRLPLVTGFVVDDQGLLWLGIRAQGAPPGRWLHLTPEGEVLGSVDLPPGEVLGAVNGDLIVTTPRVPPWDVQVIRIYRLTR